MAKPQNMLIKLTLVKSILAFVFFGAIPASASTCGNIISAVGGGTGSKLISRLGIAHILRDPGQNSQKLNANALNRRAGLIEGFNQALKELRRENNDLSFIEIGDF